MKRYVLGGGAAEARQAVGAHLSDAALASRSLCFVVTVPGLAAPFPVIVGHPASRDTLLQAVNRALADRRGPGSWDGGPFAVEAASEGLVRMAPSSVRHYDRGLIVPLLLDTVWECPVPPSTEQPGLTPEALLSRAFPAGTPVFHVGQPWPAQASEPWDGTAAAGQPLHLVARVDADQLWDKVFSRVLLALAQRKEAPSHVHVWSTRGAWLALQDAVQLPITPVLDLRALYAEPFLPILYVSYFISFFLSFLSKKQQ